MIARGKVYLDYNATAPIRMEAAEAVACALAIGGNPSSVHSAGRTARAAIERARGQVASLVGAKDGSVTFTSGGTEANALAIDSAIAAGFRRPVVGLAEHASALATCMTNGDMAEGWPVLASGLMDLDWLDDRMKTWPAGVGRPLVVVSLANNETGVIQPTAEIAAIVHAAEGWLHVDAVQAAGKIPVDFTASGADTLSLSAHKIGGPHGSGALVAGCTAAARSAAGAAGPRTFPASPALAPPPPPLCATCRTLRGAAPGVMRPRSRCSGPTRSPCSGPTPRDCPTSCASPPRGSTPSAR
jgi:cysteine desulfurase